MVNETERTSLRDEKAKLRRESEADWKREQRRRARLSTCETEEKLQQRRRADRERSRFSRECETEEQRERRLRVAREQVKWRRQNETESERLKRLSKDTQRMRNLRKSETEEQRERRLRIAREQVRRRRQNETESERLKRLSKDMQRVTNARKTETEEQRKLRLRANRERMRQRRQDETEPERQRRLSEGLQRMRDVEKSETEEHREQRLQAKRERVRLIRLIERGEDSKTLNEGTDEERPENPTKVFCLNRHQCLLPNIEGQNGISNVNATKDGQTLFGLQGTSSTGLEGLTNLTFGPSAENAKIIHQYAEETPVIAALESSDGSLVPMEVVELKWDDFDDLFETEDA